MSLRIQDYAYNQFVELPAFEVEYDGLAKLIDETPKSSFFSLQMRLFDDRRNDFQEHKGEILGQLANIQDEEKQKKVTVYLSHRLIEWGDYIDALDVLDVINQYYQSQMPIREILLKLIEQGRYDVVIQRKSMLHDIYYLSLVICKLAEAYRLKGLLHTALNVLASTDTNYGVPNEITKIACAMFERGMEKEAKIAIQPISHHYIAKPIVARLAEV